MKKNINRFISIIKFINSLSPKYIVLTVIIKIYGLCNTYLLLYISKLILNAFAEAILSNNQNILSIINLLVIASVIEILFTLIFNVFQYGLGKLKLRFDDEITLKLVKSFSTLDMSYYDDPVSYNQTKQATKCKSALLDYYNYILNLIFEILSFFIAFIVTIRFNIFITLLSIVSAIPGLIIRRKLDEKHYTVEKNLLSDQRYAEYLLSLFFNRNVEMEMQLYGFSNMVANKIAEKQKNIRETRCNNSLEKAKNEIFLLIVSKLFYIVQQAIIVWVIIRRRLTIGDYSYYSGVIKNLASSVVNIVRSVNGLHLQSIKYDEYITITERMPRIYIEGTRSVSISDKSIIEFDNVSFKYPNTNANVLSHVSFQFRIGEKIALVGENGAGKSTLIKLLLRFYDPTDGRILLDGIDIKEYDLNEYRKIFSAMYQDITLYLMSIRENIFLSDINCNEESFNERIDNILSDLDINVINGKPINLHTNYGREFSLDGYVFSKGQQQRLQAARTLFHCGSVYIFDEPAASMDALSETKFLNTFNKYTKDKLVIYITHRYNNLHIMDNILVLNKGVVVETGTHDELIRKEGIYSKMFIIQNLK